MLENSPFFFPIALSAVFFLYYVYSRSLKPGLGRIPGPFLARLTPFYRVHLLWSGQCTDKFKKLHDEYGSVVRTGPNHVIISDPAAISVIYGHGWRFPKSDFYRVFALTYNGETRDTVFSTRNLDYHKMMQSHTASRFSSPANLHAANVAIDACVGEFLQRMTAMQGHRIDLGDWAKYWAFDTNSKIKFGRPFGFMAKGGDISGIITGNDNGFRVGSLIGQVPWLNRFLLENKILMRLLNNFAGITDPTADFVDLIKEKVKEAEADETLEWCFLKWLRGEQKGSKKMDLDDATLMIHLTNYFIARSVTAATSVGAILYYTIKNPCVYEKLAPEIRREPESSVVADERLQQMTYLQAVIKEAMRLASTNNIPLERIVTPENLVISGYYLPAGTNVGTSAYIVHRDPSVYGVDADEFHPERWLDVDVSRIRRMQSHFFAFGRGERGCSGRTLAMLLVGKFTVNLLRTFDMEWASDNETWDLKTWWMPEQHGLIVKFKPLA